MLYTLSLKNTKEIWFLNNDDCNLSIKKRIVKSKKTKIINGEGINLDTFQPEKTLNNKFSFLYIGRVLWDKGIAEYVETARILKMEFPSVDFQILGALGAANPEAVTLEEMDKWVNEGVIQYLGETKNVIPFINETSCIVLPSYREGLSRELLEAAAMEKPIVTTNVTGCKDIVEDERSGFLCEPKDVGSLAACMKKMISLPVQERLKMGKEGRKIVLEKFDTKIIIDIYLQKLSHFFS